MSTILHDWVNQLVNVAIRGNVPTVMEGTLFHVDDAGICPETPGDKLFVPFTAILFVKRSDDVNSETRQKNGW
jgi:hypothetical protein